MPAHRRLEAPHSHPESIEEQLALLNSIEPFVKSSLRDAVAALKQEEQLKKTLEKVPPLSQRNTHKKALPKHLIEALQREAQRRHIRSSHIIPAKDVKKHKIIDP